MHLFHMYASVFHITQLKLIQMPVKDYELDTVWAGLFAITSINVYSITRSENFQFSGLLGIWIETGGYLEMQMTD